MTGHDERVMLKYYNCNSAHNLCKPTSNTGVSWSGNYVKEVVSTIFSRNPMSVMYC